MKTMLNKRLYTKGFIFGPNEPQATPENSKLILGNMNMPA
jgi:hypothetical protein